MDFLKYKHWFYQWGQNELHFETLDTGPCAQAVRNYWDPDYPDPYRCERALSCLLDNTNSSAQQMLATSIVILGLMPTMLSTLGPSIAESAMLSYERPLLSWLLAFGSPSVLVSRIWTYDDPFATIERPTGRSWRNSATLLDALPFRRPRRRASRIVISALELVLALAAIANTIHVSIDLGVRSVSTWNCESWYFPLSWVLIPGCIHIIGAVAFRMTPMRREQATALSNTLLPATNAAKDVSLDSPGNKLRAPVVIIAQPPTPWTLVLNSVAVGFSLGHAVYGTLVFSSLLFLMVSDAVPVIFRYASSSLLCRFINQYELALMSEEYEVRREPAPERPAPLRDLDNVLGF